MAGGVGRRTSAAWKRPESVLVVVFTEAGEVLLLERVAPEGFLQSVTGSLEPGETPAEAARRELLEETGIDAVPDDLGEWVEFEIRPEWRRRYAPGVTVNREHLFALGLVAPVAVRTAPAQHVRARWPKREAALAAVFSATNRAAIERLVPVPR